METRRTAFYPFNQYLYPQFLEALDMLKTFNPAGIGAKDLQECLLIQLIRKQKEDSLAHHN